MKISGVYKITSPSGKIYIGSSHDILTRKRRYKNIHCKSQPKLYNSIIHYGWSAHLFEIIAIVESTQRHKWEHILGMYYNVLGEEGLNCKLPSYDDIPVKFSLEYRTKLSKGRLGKKHSPEAKLKMSARNRSYENRHRTSKALKGKKQKVEHIEKRSLALRGRKLSNITKEKIAVGHRKKVIDVSTGIIYSCAESARFLYPQYCKGHISNMLKGRTKNNTTLKYI